MADLKAAGDSHGTIAAKLGTNIETVQNAVKSANGKPPRIYAKKKRGAASTTPRITYRDIASEVLLLHFSG
ncbi:MAG TPA: hypothetical protein EYQ75_16715 [Planctomycetaceae bacterium]|nr:hypothetical protein [Planctomycetaceae bacterium]